MQHHHLYIVCHATKVAKATIAYQVKHDIVDSDMVRVSTLFNMLSFINLFIFWTTHFLNFGPLIYYREPFFLLGSLAFFDPPIFVHLLLI